MINKSEILETIKMIDDEKLDIRTVTVGVSLLDCICDDIDSMSDKIYDKLCKYTSNLVKVSEEVSSNFDVPIVNKRISVTPVALLCGACPSSDPTKIALTLDKVAKDVGVDFVGGYSALVEKGFTHADRTLIDSIPQALARTDRVCSSVNVGSTKAGINLDAVKKMGEVIIDCAEKTKDKNCIAAAKLVVFCNAPQDNPFMAGAFHGIGEAESIINVGISGPGTVLSAIKRAGDCDINKICEVIKNTAFKITRLGQLIARETAKRMGIDFGIVDLSLAPTPAVGDSVARIIEEIGLETCGTHGTTAILALLNDSVKKGGVMASSHVGGLSGAFIPVSEDEGMINAVKSDILTISKLEAMTAVCSVGLDMIAIPGDTKAETISAIIADEMAIGMINAKTTATRLIPAIGKKVGDYINFGGLLGETPVIPLVNASSSKFINRGGHISAPIHSFKN